MDHFKNLFELSFDMLVVMDCNGRVVHYNSGLQKMLGYPVLLNSMKDFYTYMHPDDIASMNTLVPQLIQGRELSGYLNRFRCLDGSYKWLQWNVSLDQINMYFYVIGRDVHHQKSFEQHLAAQELWYRSCLDNLLDGFSYYKTVRDEGGDIIDYRSEYMNDTFCRMMNYSKDEAVGRLWSQLFPDFTEEIRAVLKQVTSSGKPVLRQERVYNKWLTDEESYDVLYYKMGDGFACSWRNVTEYRRAQEHLELSNLKFTSAFHTNATMNFLIDLETATIIEMNQKFSQTMRRGHYSHFVNSILQAIPDQGLLENIELPFLRQSGDTGYGVISGEVLELKNKRYFLAFAIDITELRKAKKHLLLMDKLNLLSSMAASIAHEVRNPMTTIKGFLQLMQKNTTLASYRDTLNLMISELDRANGIISEYLSLANTRFVQKEQKQLDVLVSNILPLLEADAAYSNILIVLDLHATEPVTVEEKEIRQLLLNLTRNAIEAMESGGELTIRTRMNQGDVILEVADQGHGIPKEHIEAIFTPFYTTKETGTGLGLAVCRSIAEHHGAEIEIESSEEGTTFRVVF
ncbi:ATP-binding protein [Paenibacillus sp. FSL H8-0537]|uniref:ATP-binding protein n=1 Tax=Paenibacillus sp. FSL H8-0537 TaxID=2921399 RepID=UPI0031012D2B